MKPVFDGQIFRYQKAGGINRYFAELITRLPPAWQPTVLGVTSFGAHSPQHANLRSYDGPYFRPRRLSYLARKWRNKKILGEASLFHPTYYSSPEGIEYKDIRCPVVVTVYDMIYALYPELMKGSEDLFRAQQASVQRADIVICISKATEADVLKLIPEAAGKTRVVYLGSSVGESGLVANNSRDKGASFLYVGARSTYKNFAFLLGAFSAAAKVNPEIRLRVAGPPWKDVEEQQIADLGIKERVDLHVFPEHLVLQKLYQTSLALLYPSKYEGFGIPPLEAMELGTVAVTSNTSSIPEVVGDGGIMLDPNDEKLWTDCLLGLVDGRIDSTSLVTRGYKQAARFSWEKFAFEHTEIYKGLAG